MQCVLYFVAFTFRQPATGSVIVCRGRAASFSCELVNAGGFVQQNQWMFANGTIITTDTPDHTLVLDDVTSLVSILTVTNIVTSTSYICTNAARPDLTSTVPIDVAGMCLYSTHVSDHNLWCKNSFPLKIDKKIKETKGQI